MKGEDYFYQKIKAMLTEVATRKMTYAEFKDMEIPDGDTSVYELINGEIMRRASPNSPHQDLFRELFLTIGIHVKQNKLGKTYSAPYDVVLDDESVPQPDIFFVSKEREFIINPKNGVEGAPDLIIEILSKGTAKYDKGAKKDLYERFQVKEYWIADPVRRSIEVYGLVDGRYKLVSFAEEEGKITSEVLGGFELEVSTLFI